jgi:hypothetical protein
MERLFDFLYKPDEDIWKWRLATYLAGVGAVVGLALILDANTSSAGIASGAGGCVLLLGTFLGFRHYWNNL